MLMNKKIEVLMSDFQEDCEKVFIFRRLRFIRCGKYPYFVKVLFEGV